MATSDSSHFTPLRCLDVFAGCGGEGERERMEEERETIFSLQV